MKIFYLKSVVLGASFAVVFSIMIAALIFFTIPSPQEDIEGRTPRLLLDAFLSDCRKGDLSSAKNKWTTESLERFKNHESWFAELGKLELTYGNANYGKYKTIWVIVAEGKFEGKKIWRHFYFEVRDSKWYLHRHNNKNLSNLTIHKDSQGHAAVAFAPLGVNGNLAKASFPAHL